MNRLNGGDGESCRRRGVASPFCDMTCNTRRRRAFRCGSSRVGGHPPFRQANLHAFIIEDDYLIGQSLQDMLERLGFSRFSFARSEDAAVLGAGGERIDLITADVRLLPGDGLKAVEKICKDRDIPVLFITGCAEELEERAPSATVIQKPIEQDELAAAVRQAMGRKASAANDVN